MVGGGDSAMEEATFLTRFASKVTLVHRRDVFRASQVMYDRAAAHPKIEIKTFRQVERWLSDEKGLSGAVLVDPRDGTEEELPARAPSLPSVTNQSRPSSVDKSRPMARATSFTKNTP